MNKKNQILEAAEKLFSKYSFKDISTKKIADEAGCNEVTIFRIFGSKQGLLEAIIEKFVKETKIIKQLENNLLGNIEKDIETVLRLYSLFLEENEVIFRIQLKLSDKDMIKFLGSINFKETAKKHFEKKFKEYKINFSGEAFVINMLSSIIGSFLFYIQTENSLTKLTLNEILESNIILFKNAYITLKNSISQLNP